jgi:hypothetical protein
MSRIVKRAVLAGAIALGLGGASPSIFPRDTAQAAPPSQASAADAQPPIEPSAWQQQWQLLLRREEQLRRDEQQVREIAPRMQPSIVEQLEQGLEGTRQRLAQRRQQLVQERPPGAERDVPPEALQVTLEPAVGRSTPTGPAIIAWPGS